MNRTYNKIYLQYLKYILNAIFISREIFEI